MDAIKDIQVQNFIKLLSRYKGVLTRQQLKTLRGQALGGDPQGAMKGLRKLLARSGNIEH